MTSPPPDYIGRDSTERTVVRWCPRCVGSTTWRVQLSQLPDPESPPEETPLCEVCNFPGAPVTADDDPDRVLQDLRDRVAALDGLIVELPQPGGFEIRGPAPAGIIVRIFDLDELDRIVGRLEVQHALVLERVGVGPQ